MLPNYMLLNKQKALSCHLFPLQVFIKIWSDRPNFSQPSSRSSKFAENYTDWQLVRLPKAHFLSRNLQFDQSLRETTKALIIRIRMAEKQLIVAVEGTAAMGPYWHTIVADYLEKIIRYFLCIESLFI